ncbi:hypothetical protein FBU30_000290 [Linnemannia zychae]|nr:hypothetical protein FBU30_000290 [Linnemannia zychae]
MGILKFNCMTTDPSGTTLYGLSNADRYQAPRLSQGWYKNMVLVKSNTNPSSVKSINWSFVSSYSSEKLSISNGALTVAGCAVSSQGIVTFVAAHVSFNQADPYSKYITALRYDPTGATDPVLSQGTGSWTPLTLNPSFGQASFSQIWLYYTTVGGTETLNLAFTTRDSGLSGLSVVFGVYDGTSGMFNPTGRWPMPYTTYGVMRSILFNGQEMYFYNLLGYNSTLSVYSLANVGTNVPVLSRAYDSPVCRDSVSQTHSALFQNSYYLVCNKQMSSPLTVLAAVKDVTSTGSKFSTLSTSLSTTVSQVDYFVPVGISSTNGSTEGNSFILMQATQNYQTKSQQYSISLASGTLGAVEGGADATIPEKFGTDPSSTSSGGYPYPTNSGGGNHGDSGGGIVVVVPRRLSVKVIILIVVGALLVGGGIIAFCFGCLGACCIGIKGAIVSDKSKK